MITIFDTKEQFNTYTNNGQNIPSGFLYYVKEDETVHFNTNNIDGTQEIKNGLTDPTQEGYIIPTGNVSITSNGSEIDVAQYETATVNVPIPEGYIVPTGNVSITQNGTDIDIAQYSTASVAVPQPSGNVELTQNGTNIDIADYATATVAVPQPTGNINITANGTDIDIAQYATASVNVEGDYVGNPSFSETSFTSSNISKCFSKFTIPSSVTTIGSSAFQGCSGLTSINIPSGVTRIDDSAFNRCSGLTSVSIPNSVTTIGNTVFYHCSGLESVTLECPSASLGGFNVSANNATFNIGSGVTSITNGGYLAHTFTTINIDANNQYYSDKGYNYIYEKATNTLMYGNDLAHMPSETQVIDNAAFKGCSDTSGVINIPSGVTSIGISAFESVNMITITIGSNITSIGNKAFDPKIYNVLSSLTIEATTPPTLGSSNFNNAASTFKIYVPAESVDTYKAASGWSSFASKIYAIPTT